MKLKPPIDPCTLMGAVNLTRTGAPAQTDYKWFCKKQLRDYTKAPTQNTLNTNKTEHDERPLFITDLICEC